MRIRKAQLSLIVKGKLKEAILRYFGSFCGIENCISIEGNVQIIVFQARKTPKGYMGGSRKFRMRNTSGVHSFLSLTVRYINPDEIIKNEYKIYLKLTKSIPG